MNETTAAPHPAPRRLKPIGITHVSRILSRIRSASFSPHDIVEKTPLPRVPRQGDYCGIYVITNVKTRECYVGQSVGILSRFRQHIGGLRKQSSAGWRFQASYDLHGESVFRLSVAEICNPEDLDEREIEWMWRLRPALNTAVPDYAAGSDRLQVIPKPQ